MIHNLSGLYDVAAEARQAPVPRQPEHKAWERAPEQDRALGESVLADPPHRGGISDGDERGVGELRAAAEPADQLPPEQDHVLRVLQGLEHLTPPGASLRERLDDDGCRREDRAAEARAGERL